MGDKVTFEGVGKNIAGSKGYGKVGVWTDGLMVSADNESPCAMRLVVGAPYRVTIERITVNEER